MEHVLLASAICLAIGLALIATANRDRPSTPETNTRFHYDKGNCLKFGETSFGTYNGHRTVLTCEKWEFPDRIVWDN